MRGCKYEPENEIKFAAKAGFITKNIWINYFANGSEGWKNKLWNSLLLRGYFLKHPSRRANDTLVLNPNDNLVRKLIGYEKSRAPFVSQLDHDETMARIILDLLNEDIITDYRLEPELKRMTPEVHRQFELKKKTKYPDGLIKLKNEDQTRIAIELELTRKDPKRYRDIIEAYATFKNAELVIFILRDDRLALTLKNSMRDKFYPKHIRPIGFGKLCEWNENPAKAQIIFDEHKTTLEELRMNNGKILNK